MRLPDKWRYKHNKIVAKHNLAYGRNKNSKRIAISSALALRIILLYWIILYSTVIIERITA